MELENKGVPVNELSLDQRISLLKEMFGEDIASVRFCYDIGCKNVPERSFLLKEEYMKNISELLGRVFNKEMKTKRFELVSSLNDDNEIIVGLFDGKARALNQDGKSVNYDFEFFYKENNGISVTRYISEQKQVGSMRRALDIEEMFLRGADCYDNDCKELLSEIVNVSISGLFNNPL